MSLINIILNNTRVGEAIKDKAEDVSNSRVGEFVKDVHKGAVTGLVITERVGQTLENGLDSWQPESYLRKFFGPGVANLKEGDHLWVQRIGYTHHGIYIGAGQVVHYLQEGVSLDSLETFAAGSKVHKLSSYDSPARFNSTEVIERAFSRLGEDSYNLGVNNCEHFCRWCRNGH